jgi:iron complex outermembrane recepter protein
VPAAAAIIGKNRRQGGSNMSHRRQKRARQAARVAITTVVSIEAMLSGQAVMAQAQATGTTAQPASDATPPKSDALEEIVVTGYRASLESALDNKRDALLPIESIAPEDIGKMPDQNVAEALQRLPGIQIDRSQGQGTQVLIDGLRQNLTTLNGDLFLTGREFYVSGEGSGGGAGGNAQYNSLEGIPSEEINGIDVYKNPKASMIEGGVGGTIDLKTLDPLAAPMGLTFGGNLRGTSADGTGGVTPNGTLVSTFKVSDRLAFTGSVSYDKENTHTNEFQDENRNQWTVTNSYLPPYTGSPQAGDYTTRNQYYIDPQLAYFSGIDDTRTIIGTNFGVAFQVTDSIKTRATWFRSSEDDTSLTYTNKAWFNGAGGQVTPVKDSFGNPVYNASGAPEYNVPLIAGIDPSQPYSIDPHGVVQNGTFNANGAETATLYQRNKDLANNYQWVTNFDAGGPVRGTFAAFYARATSNLQADQADVEHGLYETGAGVPTAPGAPGCNNGSPTCVLSNGAPDPNGAHGYQFIYANGGTSGLPSVSYAPNPNVLNNPASTTFKSNWAWANYTAQEQKAFKLDGSWEQSPGTTLSAGLRYATRDVDQIFGRYLINGTLANGQVAGNNSDPNGGPWLYYQDPGYGTPNIPYSTALSNPALAMNVHNFAAGTITVKNPYTGGMTNPSTYLQTVWAGAGVPNTTEQFFEDKLSSFTVDEKTYAGYLMGDIGGKQDFYHVNVGVRLLRTDLVIDNGASAEQPTYYGTAIWNGVDSNVVPVRTDRSYTDVLPSINLTFKLTDEQIVRVGAAKVTSPQDLFLLGVGNSYNFTRVTNSSRPNVNNGSNQGFAFANGTSGNTQLDPYRATQFLVSYENYFAKGALASVEAFSKLIDSFVTLANVPTLVLDDFGGTQGNVQQPINAGSGQIYGLEFTGQYNFDWDFLRGFGIASNYTYSQSNSNQSTSFATHTPIPGVSTNALTATVFYERFGFSGRLSYSYRSKAVNDSLVGSTFSFPDQNGNQKVYQVFQAPYAQLDGQIGYDFTPNLGLVLSAQNLTREALHTYLQWPDQPFTYDNWGRRYFFGIKFKN